MKCELCDKKIKQGFFGFFVKDHEKGIKSATISYIGRNPWVHKLCFRSVCNALLKKKKINMMEEIMLNDYKMMQKMGEIT